MASSGVGMGGVELRIAVVGCGIAGLAAAIALRKAGHEVEIFEQSSLANEVGAAINICPNATRVLVPWGMDPERAQMVVCEGAHSVLADSLKTLFDTKFENMDERFGGKFYFSHRVDLHNELKLMATMEDAPGKPAKIHLESEVVDADSKQGKITLSDGSVCSADVIVVSDGVHSRFTQKATGEDTPAQPTGTVAFRFLIDTEAITADKITRELLEGREGYLKIFIGQGDRRIVWYACRAHKVQNLVMICPETQLTKASESWKVAADLDSLLNECQGFHPALIEVCRKATDLKLWKLVYRPPISPWFKDRLVLTGDAAHPMLPHQGQGGAQSVEDGAALGIALSDMKSNDLAEVSTRLDAYQQIRRRRASAIQIFSNAAQDQAEKVKADAEPYVDGKIPSNPGEFQQYNFSHDVVAFSRHILAAM